MRIQYYIKSRSNTNLFNDFGIFDLNILLTVLFTNNLSQNQLMKEVRAFLEGHKLLPEYTDIHQFVNLFTSEMLKGLEGRDSSLRMIPTYIEADNQYATGMPVLAIDAGGTNFRAALIKVSSNGELEIGNIVSSRMPGIDGEISKSEFFNTIAGYIRDIAIHCERIGFCFSYATEILPSKDGILLQFCKEVEAPEVVGQLIGKNLLNALDMSEKQIVLLNDTVATLLAGKSASSTKKYDSFIGYILGTGSNTCYIEKNSNILKKEELDSGGSQIVNIESGNFGLAPRSDLDISFNNTTNNPAIYTFEKMFSGAYFGGLSLHVLKAAAKEGVFSEKSASCILSLTELSSEEVNDYVSKSGYDRGPLFYCIKDDTDALRAAEIINNLIERASKLVAATIAAVILKTDKGKSSDCPLLITIEGSFYYKAHNLQALFKKYLNEYLSGENQRFYEFTEVKKSSLVGAALAALIN